MAPPPQTQGNGGFDPLTPAVGAVPQHRIAEIGSQMRQVGRFRRIGPQSLEEGLRPLGVQRRVGFGGFGCGLQRLPPGGQGAVHHGLARSEALYQRRRGKPGGAGNGLERDRAFAITGNHAPDFGVDISIGYDLPAGHVPIIATGL